MRAVSHEIWMVFALAALLAGCSKDGGGTAKGNVRILNGATAAARGKSNPGARPIPGDGQWSLSPDEMTLTATSIQLTGPGSAVTVNCPVPFKASSPGLTALGDCPVTLPAGTFTAINITFSNTYTVLINDSTNGFYSTASGIVTSPPAGGAAPLTVQTQSTAVSKSQIFTSPLTVTAGGSVDISVIVEGLHSFPVGVTSGVVTPGFQGGGNNGVIPMPDLVMTANSIAKVGYYVSQHLGTAGSWCSAGACHTTFPEFSDVTALYTSASTVSIVAIGTGGGAGCPAAGLYPSFANQAGTYQGLDPLGNISWAVFADQAQTIYSAEFSFAQQSTLGQTTTLYCKNITTDPAPSGGSFASGAPNIAVPGNVMGTYILVAQ